MATQWLCASQNFEREAAKSVPRGWRDRYTKTLNFTKMGDKNVLKTYQKPEVGC